LSLNTWILFGNVSGFLTVRIVDNGCNSVLLYATLEIDMTGIFEKYGHAISDYDGDLRDIGEVIAELEEVQRNFSTHAMSEHQLFLNGKAEMLSEVIQYLRRI
jgi:hypothetical protein